jgi:hypothetical protein
MPLIPLGGRPLSASSLFGLAAFLITATAARGLDVRFDAKGLSSFRVDGNELFYAKAGPPSVAYVYLEEITPSSQGYKKYQFAKGSIKIRGSAFDAASKVLKQEYDWGEIEYEYRPGTDRLDMAVTVRNQSPKTIANFGLELAELAFPAAPKSLKEPRWALRWTLDDLVNVQAEVGSGRLLVTNLTMDPPFVLGFERPTDKAGLVFPLVLRGGVYTPAEGTSWTEPQGLPRVAPGKALTLEFTLRWAAPGAKAANVLADAYRRFRDYYKSANDWEDRRPIAMLMLSSASKEHHSATNPRGWFSNPKLDAITRFGKTDFQQVVVQSARQSVKVIKQTGGQGMILWDVEGQENPHPISFIGDPQLAKKLAPEMDEVADAYFKVFRDAGLRTGVCIRPSQVYFDEEKKQWAHGTGSDGGPGRGDSFPELRPKDVPWWRFYPIAQRLSARIDYVKKRWGCTLFYVDTNGTFRQFGDKDEFRWILLESAVWKKVKQDHPDVLLIPELQEQGSVFHTAYWAYTAAYMELRGKGYGTPDRVRDLVPGAFSVINVGEGDLKKNPGAIRASVAKGDVLMFRGWFDDDRNAWVRAVYKEAKAP